jgi:hypothetical protein
VGAVVRVLRCGSVVPAGVPVAVCGQSFQWWMIAVLQWAVNTLGRKTFLSGDRNFRFAVVPGGAPGVPAHVSVRPGGERERLPFTHSFPRGEPPHRCEIRP